METKHSAAFNSFTQESKKSMKKTKKKKKLPAGSAIENMLAKRLGAASAPIKRNASSKASTTNRLGATKASNTSKPAKATAEVHQQEQLFQELAQKQLVPQLQEARGALSDCRRRMRQCVETLTKFVGENPTRKEFLTAFRKLPLSDLLHLCQPDRICVCLMPCSVNSHDYSTL